MNGRSVYSNKISLGRSALIVKLGLAVFAVCLLVMSVCMLIEYNRLELTEQRLNLQLDEAKVRVSELEYELDAPMDRSYIIRVAREKLGLVLPEEVVYYTDIDKID